MMVSKERFSSSLPSGGLSWGQTFGKFENRP